MRLYLIFLKTWREFLRDGWMLGLTLAFAPFFVLLYWLWFQGGSTSYTVLVINRDQGAQTASGERLLAGQAAVEAISAVRYEDGKGLVKVQLAGDRAEVEKRLRERSAAAFIEIPEEFSRRIADLKAGNRSASVSLAFGGDLTNPYYTVGSVLALSAVESYVMAATGQQPLIQYLEEPLAGSGVRTEFETYVPGVLIFAVILLIFLSAMTIAREVESGALRRLQITPMTAFDLIGGVSLALAVVGVGSVLLTFATAAALGFHSQGPVWVAALVGALASLSVIGIGMLVACYSGSVSRAFVVANFPLGLLMFFSGSIFPLPKVTLLTLGGHAFGLYDLLPPTHAVVALNKVLTLGAGLGDVTYELGMLTVLSLVFLGAGVWLFQRRYLRV